ncbi:MAG: YbaB/EbfC family nucleoid-associated protein [Elusimicrobiota bacterium]
MDIMKLMKQAKKLKKVQKEINKKKIEEQVNGAKLSITGGGKLNSLEISDDLWAKGKSEVENAVSRAIEACMSKQQDLQKKMAKDAMGGMKLPDMFG